MSALQAAARAGDLKMVQYLLRLGADVNMHAHGDSGVTALQAAIRSKNTDLVYFLLGSGADINADGADEGYTALGAAVESQNLPLVVFLIDAGADVNKVSGWCGESAIEAAVEIGDLDLVRLLLESGADDAEHRMAALTRAFDLYSDVELIGQLLKYGLDIDYRDPDGTTILARAVEENSELDVLELLLAHGANDTSTALHVAAIQGNFEVMELLLKHNADPAISIDGTTAISEAARHGDAECVKLLFDWGATDMTGALQAAADTDNVELIQLFLSKGVDVNAFTIRGGYYIETTALEVAAARGNVVIVRLLLDSGATADSPANPNSLATPLQRAAIAGNLGVVDELIQRGADVNAPPRGDFGRTALEGAAENGRLDIMQLLINVQADVEHSKALEFAREEGHDAVVEISQKYS